MAKINFNTVARSLAVVSLGLGLAELLMPKRIQKLVGVRGKHTGLIRLLGLREIGHALAILPQQKVGVWSRVAGDAIDLGLMGAAFTTPRAKKDRMTAVTASLVGIGLLDALTAVQISRPKEDGMRKYYGDLTKADLNNRSRSGAFHVMKTLRINASPSELYQFWRNFENLPQFMYHLEAVGVIDERRSHWMAKAPAGQHVEWDAEITEDRPNERIAWKSTVNADVPNSGSVQFTPAPQGRGTIVKVEIEYRPPAGAIGKTVAKLFGESPSQQVEGDLRRFKQIIETGEVLRSDGSPKGYGEMKQYPAQPMTEKDYQTKINDEGLKFEKNQVKESW